MTQLDCARLLAGAQQMSVAVTYGAVHSVSCTASITDNALLNPAMLSSDCPEWV